MGRPETVRLNRDCEEVLRSVKVRLTGIKLTASRSDAIRHCILAMDEDGQRAAEALERNRILERQVEEQQRRLERAQTGTRLTVKERRELQVILQSGADRLEKVRSFADGGPPRGEIVPQYLKTGRKLWGGWAGFVTAIEAFLQSGDIPPPRSR